MEVATSSYHHGCCFLSIAHSLLNDNNDVRQLREKRIAVQRRQTCLCSKKEKKEKESIGSNDKNSASDMKTIV